MDDSPPAWPRQQTVITTPISLTSYDENLALIDDRPRDRASVFHYCNVHSVMSARTDRELATAFANADVNTPDGMPLVWALRKLANPEQQRVYGPDLMAKAFPYGVDRGWKHYFYGATEATLDKLVAAAERMAPGIKIVGRHAPPFRPLTTEERATVLEDIRQSGADIVWVGIGMPKQEKWMADVADELPGMALMGVGAAFDLNAGTVPQAPGWIQDRGLEWAYRLYREPRRLWKRYVINNPLYLVLLAKQLVTSRRAS